MSNTDLLHRYKLRTVLQRWVLLAGFVVFILSFLTAIYLSNKNSREQFRDQNQAILNSLAQLLQPSLQISNYNEVKRLLGSIGNTNEIYAVVTREGDVLLKDYKNLDLVSSRFLPIKKNVDCVSFKTSAGLSKFDVLCHDIAAKTAIDGQKNPEDSLGILTSFVPHQMIALSPSVMGQFLLVALVTLLFIILILRKILDIKFLRPLEKLVGAINIKSRDPLSGEGQLDNCESIYVEINDIKLAYENLMANLREEYALRVDAEQHLAYVHIAQQVAHDIKSPLAALGVLQQDLSELAEEKRILLRSAVKRIGDIANDLSIRKSKSEEALKASGLFPLKGNGTEHDLSILDDDQNIHLIPAIVESLVSEKRLQHRSRMNVEIESDLSADSYGLFACVELREFKRVLSNLVNNAVEAMGERGGTVCVSLTHPLPAYVTSDNIFPSPSLTVREGEGGADVSHSTGGERVGYFTISISDTGKGIAPEILPKLMQRGQTHGKSGGSGLGLYHAKTTMQGWGGDVQIASEIGKGTTVTLTLPRAPLPDWFVPELKIMPGSTVVIVDDDHSIHEIWKNRLGKLVKENGVKLKHFSSPVSSSSPSLVPQERGQGGELYLCDYEYINCGETGLDMIERLGVGSRAFLVTSHFEEAGVRARCKKLGVQLLPKNLSGFVPISLPLPTYVTSDNISPSPSLTLREGEGDAGCSRSPGGERVGEFSASTVQRPPSTVERPPSDAPDAILIDDDPLVHMNWKMKARVSKKLLRTFTNPAPFFSELEQLDRKTPIYVDSSLGDNLKGEDVTKALSEQGFTNLYLATGYDKSRFPHMPWVKDIVDKMPPWN